ncbi:MAG: hypothetical protein KAS63_04960 [Candidatus Heimdallarchaeota archaeon]|nr:hypothetical protein [Candidatus Heimdallarchaeota archaeon]MCK4954686.1 hypothetical protein [Candidatus Heimdallarchaeota archaeon]
MKPPLCVICYKEFLDSDEGGLVYFKKRNSDERWEKMMSEEDLIGHPPYADWFCEKHYTAAKELQNLPLNEAVKILNERFPKE